jgi:hypothetical protein
MPGLVARAQYQHDRRGDIRFLQTSACYGAEAMSWLADWLRTVTGTVAPIDERRAERARRLRQRTEVHTLLSGTPAKTRGELKARLPRRRPPNDLTRGAR